MQRCSALNRWVKPNCNTLPERLAASSIARASARVKAAGFSHNTWRPAASEHSACSRWKALGEATKTASTSSLRMASSNVDAT